VIHGPPTLPAGRAGIIGRCGSAAAPYSNALADQCALATDMTAATHPSRPNSVALTSGVLQVWNESPQRTPADNLFHQLGPAGDSWLALEEDTRYSVLASIEAIDGLPLLGAAATATPLGPAIGF